MSDLELLLEKVRMAEAGSRELDGEIFNAVIGVNAHDAKRWYGGGIESYVTTSIDAIVALIERELPGWCSSVGRDRNGKCFAYVWSVGADAAPPEGSAEGMPSRSIALCAAFLSAKIQTGSGETGNE